MFGTRNTRRRRIDLRLETLEGRELLSGAATASVPGGSAEVATLKHGKAAAATQTSARWAWLANTYWYVPKSNLASTIYDPATGALLAVTDQTVFQITGYRRGYFWGRTVAQLGSGSPSSSAMVGSVTPDGRVLLTFTTTSASSSTPTVTQGFGMMTRRNGRWTMLNQKFTLASDGTQLGHWAYMEQTRPGLKSWRSLPAARVSVPTFLGNYTGPAPTPVI